MSVNLDDLRRRLWGSVQRQERNFPLSNAEAIDLVGEVERQTAEVERLKGALREVGRLATPHPGETWNTDKVCQRLGQIGRLASVALGEEG